jgi:ABC-2 type transport system ATP-binding protein
MNIVEINQLTKYYGNARGIVDVSFNIAEGEIFGFIGPNGAGKSTTIRTILGLIYPTSGSAKIFGKDIIREGAEIRKEVGYLPSEVLYYDNMRVIDILKYSASFYNKDCDSRITELAAIMDLDLNRKVNDLSYGNKKKVGIVQGLIHSPKLIILDEPTSGLDPLMQQKFFDLILAENEKGATVLFSSHILGEVQKLCNRVAIIRDGQIVKLEDIKTLRENNYKKFYVDLATQVEVNDFLVAGVNNLEYADGTLSFMFKGDINAILKEISKHQIHNLLVEEPSLEEIFMHYYVKE